MACCLLCSAALAQVQFTDQAASLGLSARHVSGTSQSYIVETTSGGAAFLDYDNDGDLDVYLTNGSRFEGFPPGQHPRDQLYRNDGQAFADVTLEAGLGDTSWSMGCVAADYDNDGDLDLYLTNFGRNVLYRNEGNGRFADLTERAGVGHLGWSTGCTFGDYDRDGDVDLYVANYLDFDIYYRPPSPCTWKNVEVFCGPVGLVPAADVFYRNNGDGTFSEATREAGLAGPRNCGFGATFSDLDHDGWPDIFVADDTTPNMLFRNLGNGRFQDVALLAGVAYNGEGARQGCMGVALADYDNDGLTDIFVSNFSDEYNALYRNEGNGFFTDVSFASRVAAEGVWQVGWGTAFFDFDNDGDRDIFVANGHTYPQADLPQVHSRYRQRNLLFENTGDGRFAEISQRAGPGFEVEEVSRGAAFGDYDQDGDLDILVVNLNSAPTLLRNDGGNRNNWLLVKTVGQRSNRDGIGARLVLHAGGRRQYGEVQSGTSYLSHSDLRLHFGLGQAQVIDSLQVRWPSGAVQTLRKVAVNQVLEVVEPR
jgi:hypothetical protein